MNYNDITGKIIETAIEIYRNAGPGLLESVYQEILFFELKNNGLYVIKEAGIPVFWKDVNFDIGFRADLIVENKVIVELKSVEKLKNVHKKQLLTYLKLSNFSLGLLINFGEAILKNGIHRIVNNLNE